MSDYPEKSCHNLNLYCRNKLNATGISSVDSFDEVSISATTIDGETLFIEGNGISLTDVNVEKECFEASGEFYSFQYSRSVAKQRKGFLSRLFSSK